MILGALITAIACAPLVLTPPALAGGQQAMQGQQFQTQNRQQARVVRVTGQVAGTRTATVSSTNREHLLVSVTTQGNQRIVADLGPANEIPAPRSGQTITVYGRLVQMSGQPVVIARQASLGNRMLRVRQPVSQTRMQAQHGAPQEISGRVTNAKKVDIQDSETQNLVVLLLTPQGQRVAADLGPVQELRAIPVRIGDRLTVRGSVVRVGDRPTIFAQEVRSDRVGQAVAIDRSEPQQAQPAALPREAGQMQQPQEPPQQQQPQQPPQRN
jgi:hypothetical protein